MPRARYIAERAQRQQSEAQREERRVLVRDKSREARRVIAAMERRGYVLTNATAPDGEPTERASGILWEARRERRVRRWRWLASLWRFLWRSALWLFVLAVVWNATK